MDPHTQSELSPTLVMVIHGPDAFDQGDVSHILEYVTPSRILVAGVMGRTAAEESGIAFECDGLPPSEILNSLWKKQSGFLVNHGKNPESGRIFGEIVAGRMGEERGMVHVEYSSNTIFVWNRGDEHLARRLGFLLGFKVLNMRTPSMRPSSLRTIRGCTPGEPIFVEGIVIGHATGDTAVIQSINGRLRCISGINQKEHGLEKLERLGGIDAGKAWCKSGFIRSKRPACTSPTRKTGKILVIDHAGCDLYNLKDEGICGVLSIGDDTTAVCGHICSHLGIPVFGVTDGDGDGIVPSGFAPGSVVVQVVHGRDDDVGSMLAGTIDTREYCWDHWIKETLESLNGTVKVVVDGNEPSDSMRGV
jgi:hypothetical protein